MTNEKYYQMMSQAFYTFLESFSHDSEWHRFLKKFKPVNYTPVEVELPGKEHSWQYRGLFECYFRVKEIPGWRFGVWLSEPRADQDCYDGKGNVREIHGTWFCSYEKHIDKFYPSRCNFAGDFAIILNEGYSYCKPIHYPTSFILYALNFIRKNKYIAWYYDVDSGTPYARVSKSKAFIEYCKENLYDWWDKTAKAILNKFTLSIYRKYNFYGLKNAQIYDRGPTWYPRFEMRCPLEGNEEMFGESGYSWPDERFEKFLQKKLKKVHILATILGKRYYSIPIDDVILVYDNIDVVCHKVDCQQQEEENKDE